MLASVLSSFTRNPSRIADEHSYQSLVVRSLMLRKDTEIIPLGTESSHYLILDHENTNALNVINNRIQKQLNSSSIIFIAIDRGLTETMIARAIEASQKNPDIIIKFFTLYGNDNIVGQLVNAVNNETFDDNMKRISTMMGHLKGLYLRNKMLFNQHGDLTNYKIKYFSFLREINESQDKYTNTINTKYEDNAV